MIKLIKKLFKSESKTSLAELYLSNAVSLEEVERRQREIERGQAPYQRWTAK